MRLGAASLKEFIFPKNRCPDRLFDDTGAAEFYGLYSREAALDWSMSLEMKLMF